MNKNKLMECAPRKFIVDLSASWNHVNDLVIEANSKEEILAMDFISVDNTTFHSVKNAYIVQIREYGGKDFFGYPKVKQKKNKVIVKSKKEESK